MKSKKKICEIDEKCFEVLCVAAGGSLNVLGHLGTLEKQFEAI